MMSKMNQIVWLCLLATLTCTTGTVRYVSNHQSITSSATSQKFPNSFNFGAATAAYQIEGAWNVSGKGASIWDDLVHDHPELIADHANADVGADSFDHFEDDIRALKETGMQFYRFSIAWSRVLPDGDISSLNVAGIAYYSKLIDRLLANEIEPMITMYHYDLPSALQRLGGLTNPLIVDYFQQYADLLFSRFGDRVRWWITFNEPFDFCVDGYGSGELAPLVQAPGVGEYYCVDHVLQAHATAFHLYHNKYQKSQGGKVGITLSSRFFYDAGHTDADVNIVDRAMQYQLGWLAHPIFSRSGGYPAVMVEDIASNSVREGRARSRLPNMSTKWRQYIQGSADFLGLNYYTSRMVDLAEVGGVKQSSPSWAHDARLKMTVDPLWPQSKSTWLYSVPAGLGDILRWIRDEYNNPEVIITENGWSDAGEINDTGRIDYLRKHLQEVLKAVNDDTCNVTGYAVWSIIDNFEWLKGFTEKFGLYSVDLLSADRERKPKKSAEFMRNIIATRSIPKF